MRHLRIGVVLLAGALSLGVTAGPVSAGGSPFSPHKDRVEPGERVTVVGYTGGGQLGSVDDGPFYGYLRVDPAAAEQYLAQRPDSDERVTPFDSPLGPLVLQQTGRGGYLALRAAITFTIPRDLPPGTYGFVYCNDPCTTGLGDLMDSQLFVGVDPPHPLTRYWPADEPALQGAPATVPLPPPPPTTTAAPTTAAPATTAPRTQGRPAAAAEPGSTGEDGSSFPWLPAGAGVVALVVVLAGAVRPRPNDPEPTTASVDAPVAPRAERTEELLHR